jgi:hypothetical protein
MKFLKILLLSVILLIIVIYIWLYQKNDTMLMKHWIELFVIEAFIQEILFLLRNPKKN